MVYDPTTTRPRWRRWSVGNLLLVFGTLLLGAALAAAAVGTPKASRQPPPDQTAVPTLSPGTLTSRWPPLVQAPVTAPAPVPSPVPRPRPTVDTVPVLTPTSSLVPTPTPVPDMPPPTRIRIPSVGIDAPVVQVGYEIVEISGQKVIQWQVADYAAGHHSTSASPGEGGNIVISGHSDWRGEVFRTLEYAKIGDEVILTTENGDYRYRIVEIHYRKEVGVPLEERIATGRFLDPMPEERVTLVTCWPYGVDDHRIIVVAKPVVPQISPQIEPAPPE